MNIAWNVIKAVWCIGAIIQTVEWAAKKLERCAVNERRIDSIEDQLGAMIHANEIDATGCKEREE